VALIKSLFDSLLTWLGLLVYGLGLGRLLIRAHRASPKVLMYHAVDEVEDDFIRGLSINTTPRQFAYHLDFLSSHYRIVGLDQLLEGRTSGPTVAITFDDGFRSVYENAWPLLRSRRAMATCYLTTDVIGNDRLIWLNELDWFLRRHESIARPMVAEWLGLPRTSSIERLLPSLVVGYGRPGIDDLLGRLRAAAGVDPARLARESHVHLDWDQVAEMSAAGVAFGNHTGSHPPLGNLSPESCREEIERAAGRLAHLPGAATTLAYPFGSRSELTREVALSMGMKSLLEVEGVNAPLDPTRIGRIKVGSFSVPVLFARMEVLEPIKAWLKRILRSARS
jgi:peptidoglycan/xylan/chitin deacetylase (PgdA/CDA1 family)